VVPSSGEAERAVLASLLIEPDRLPTVVEALRPEHFYEERHGLIYQTILEQYDASAPLDPVSLSTALARTGRLERAGGIEYLGRLAESLATTAALEHYVTVVRNLSLVRQVLRAASDITDEGFRGDIDPVTFVAAAEKRMAEAMEGRQVTGAEALRDLLVDTFREIDDIKERKGEVTGLPTGFMQLDDMTLGCHPGDLVIIAARPSMGKTTFAMNVALNTARHGHAVVVFSLEMTKRQLVQRLLSSYARVDLKDLRSGRMDAAAEIALNDAAAELAEAQVYIDDTPALSTLDLRARCRRLHAEGHCSMIVVDYLQLMRVAGVREGGRKVDSREQEISEISRALKGIAKELGVPVLALSQLNRGLESRQDKRPILSDLRESGAIEQDADVIVFIYRDEVYNKQTQDAGIAEIIIGKQRNGPTGTVRLRFNGQYTRFDNLAEGRYEDYSGM
jgi:replicative DNA helicase